jgi:hypothetical protein
MIEECLMSAAINYGKHQTGSGGGISSVLLSPQMPHHNARYLRPKVTGGSSHVNPHHRFSNYLAYSSTYQPMQQHQQQLPHQSRSDSCGPAFRNSLSGLTN